MYDKRAPNRVGSARVARDSHTALIYCYDALRPIIMARSSTTMHKPKSRSKGVYDGEPSHLRWVGANLVIAKSDGSSNARYHDVGLGDVKEEADGKKRKRPTKKDLVSAPLPSLGFVCTDRC